MNPRSLPLLLLVLLVPNLVAAAPPTLQLTGGLVSFRRVDVQARVSGLLQEVRFQEGMRFRKGDVLAVIEPDLFELDVRQAEAEVEAAKARLAAMEAGGRPAERAVARAELEAAESSLALAEQEFARTEKLRKTGGTTPQALDRAREQLQGAESRLAAAKQRLALVTEGPRPEEKRVARAALTSARVHLERARIQLGYTQIRAPFDGIIGRRLVDPGQYVLAASSPQSPVVCVYSDTSKIKAILDIPERQMPFVRLGQEAKIFVQASPEPILGKVSNLYPFVDPATRLGKLEVLIPNDPVRIVPGMFARAELVASEVPARTADDFFRGQ